MRLTPGCAPNKHTLQCTTLVLKNDEALSATILTMNLTNI
jgi:hypothetical protein